MTEDDTPKADSQADEPATSAEQAEPSANEPSANEPSASEPSANEPSTDAADDESAEPGGDTPAELGSEPKAEKRTSASFRGAALPVALTLLLAIFIVYPYLKQLREGGAEPISPQGSGSPVKFSEDARRLLEGIDEGGTVEGFKVQALRGPIRGRLEIELERSGQRLRVFVSRQDTIDFAAPRKTQMYAVYYENAKPDGNAVKGEEYLALVEAIAKTVEKHERQVSMPAGL